MGYSEDLLEAWSTLGYPATLRVDRPDRVARWRPLVHWLIVIPHIGVLFILISISQIVTPIAWVIILVTGKLPEVLAGFQTLALRYHLPTFAYLAFLTDKYPPFEFEMTATDQSRAAVRVDVTPERDNRRRVTVLLRLITIIPAMLFTCVSMIAGIVCVGLGFFAVIFMGRWPQGLFNVIEGTMRVWMRCFAYVALLTDKYPPFNLR